MEFLGQSHVCFYALFFVDLCIVKQYGMTPNGENITNQLKLKLKPNASNISEVLLFRGAP